MVVLGLDSRGLTAGAAQAQGSLAKLSTGATKGLGAIPIGAAAAGFAIGKFAMDSVKAAVDFDQAFGRIAAISNASAADIEQWREEVLALSGETARAPQELADALFFLSSAGLESGQVMETLEMSAKAAAAGLGSTVDIANITASALNAYAESGLTAAQVTDTLVAAVREGRAEPEEFAGALGKILPIASQAGVTFDQVTASLAALSNIGLDVDEGVTAMRGVLQAIVAPGNLAAKALASIGLSAQDMLDAISERGLFGALQMLDAAAKRNTTTQADYIGILRKVVPNVRALTGVLGLTGQEAEKVDAIFHNVMDSTGSLAEAFGETAETDAFKFKQAMNDASLAGLELAQNVLPLIVAVMDTVSESVEGVLAPLDLVTEHLSFLQAGGEGAGFSVGGLIDGLRTLADPLKAARDPIGRFQEAWSQASGQVDGATGSLEEAQAAVAAWNGAAPEFRAGIFAAVDGFLGLTVQSTDAKDALVGGVGAIASFLGIAPQAEAAADGVGRAHHQGAQSAREFAAALELWGEISGESTSAVQQAVHALREDYNKLLEDGKSSIEAWGSVTGDVMQEAAADFASWRDEAAGNLNFVASTFGDIASDFKGSATEIASALRTSLGEQRRFAADLATILEDDTAGAKLLVEQLLEMGPAGADAARTIASASDDTRASIERSLSLGQSMAETTASKLQEVLVGTLKDIRNILEEIAIHWGIDLDANDGGAKNKLTALETRLLRLERDPYVAEVDAVTAAALADVSNLYGALHALEVHNWKATVIVETVGGSTGFHLLEMLREKLDTFEGVQATALVRVNVVNDLGLEGFGRILERLGEVTSAIGTAVGEGLSKSFLREAKELEAAGDDLVANLERRGERLQRVFDKLVDRAQEFGDSVRSAFDVDLAAGLGSLEELTQETAAQFLTDQLNQAQTFASSLTQLQAEGLGTAGLEQLLGMGTEKGIEVAQLLLASPELLAQFNATQTALDDLGKTTEETLVDSIFGPSLEKAAEHIARFTENAAAKMDGFTERIRDFIDSFDSGDLPKKFADLADALEHMLDALDAPSRGGGGSGGAGNGGAGNGGSGTNSAGLDYERLAEEFVFASRRAGPVFTPVLDVSGRAIETLGRIASRRAPL